ncbi:hypothetical protein POM88_006843 [Heracleum sosnowskyi]|uniref:Uncharacterized protein n=1 Tax=Heracleum sosnowskyi TaxID=360622 RepID=A0AAD8J3C3_9APIA|nr:hypothetical protein POM88_006843 [Heracleum sosnowskyi]
MNVYTSSVCCSRSSRQMVKPFMAFHNIIIQKYSNNGGEESTNKPVDGHEKQERLPRAPSTAEQFEKVAQEKAKHGVERQTVDKAEDAIEEATIGESSQFEHIIKETYKGPVGKGISHKTEDV